MGGVFIETELMEGRRKRDAAELDVILFRGGGCRGRRIKKKGHSSNWSLSQLEK